MSRVGKLPVAIPTGVKVDFKDLTATIKGAKTELKMQLPPEVTVKITDGKIEVTPNNDTGRARAMWGMTRATLQNMVVGVTAGFTKTLEIQGVGFRAAVDKGLLTMSLGFSHEIKYAIPAGVEMKVEKQTTITITGADKQLVGQVAAELRRLRKPEPYKGKGVRYSDEKVRRKEGKKK